MATTGMNFSLDRFGNPSVQTFPDYGGNAEAPFTGDWQICVTGVPGNVSAATVLGLLSSSPVALPLPFPASLRWKIPYSSLGSACQASTFS